MRKECIIIKNDIKARTNLSVKGKEQLKIDTYDQLLKKITGRIECGVAKAADEIRKSQLATYWDAGRYIVEYEQNGKKHAEYGLELLKKLAKDLTLRFGRGYSRPNLYNMRKFYQLYPEGYEAISPLTWSHVCELIRIEDEVERQFYTNQCIDEKWNVRTLQRQKKSALFLRLATTKNKNELLIKYSTYGMESNLFVSKYELYLPDVEELKRIVNNTMDGADESESV